VRRGSKFGVLSVALRCFDGFCKRSLASFSEYSLATWLKVLRTGLAANKGGRGTGCKIRKASVVCRTAPALRCVSHGYGCRRSLHSGFVVRSHQNCKGAEFGFARQTRRSHLRGVPSPKSERVRRKWISSTFLVTCLQRPDYFNDLNCRVVGPRFVDSFL
jgi:hypothetical protein